MSDPLYRSVVENQYRQRFPFFTTASILGILLMAGFGVFNALTGGVVSAYLSFATALVIAVLSLAAYRSRRRQLIYVVGFVIAESYLLYLFSRGGADGSLTFWMFCVPLIAFLLLGRRDGAVVSLIGLVGIVMIFLRPDWFVPGGQDFFEPVSQVRFIITYLFIGLLSLVFESVRTRLAVAAVERQEQLEAANARISHLSHVDSLTGCFNRLYFDEQFPKELKKALRHDGSLSFILCDIDLFKMVNDTYGHQAGDKVLQAVAQVMQECVREDLDWVARCGGEEFGVVLPNTDLREAVEIASRIRLAIEQTAVKVDAAHVSVTASLGVAQLATDSETVGSLYQRADERLYLAKEAGKNRVAFS